MAAFAGVKLNKVADNVLHILTIETLAACQGIDFRAPLHTSPRLQCYVDAVRAKVAFYHEDRYFGHDLSEAQVVIRQSAYYGAVYEQFFHPV